MDKSGRSHVQIFEERILTASIYGEVDDIFNIWEIIESMEVVEDE